MGDGWIPMVERRSSRGSIVAPHVRLGEHFGVGNQLTLRPN